MKVSDGNLPKNKKIRLGTGVIIVIAMILVAVTFMNALLVFRMTAQQTRNAGIYQLSVISGELESTISGAENLTMELGLQARAYLDDRRALEQFIYFKKRELQEKEQGFLSLYIAGTGWDIVPDFTDREGFVATDRVWYSGAKRARGSTFITPPYVDVVTGQVCYTISVMLGDNDTVIGVDYTMENIHRHIMQMSERGLKNAVIVTGQGIIAGCTNENLIGKRLNDALPDYAAVYSLSKGRSGVVTSRVRAGLFEAENLFAIKARSGWYLIVSESDWDLYRESYIQLILTTILILAVFAVIIFLYVLTLRSRKRAEQTLVSRDAFLESLTEELKAPLKKIMDSSDPAQVALIEDSEEEFSVIHEAGERLSEKIGQIASYSNLVRTEGEEDNRKRISERTYDQNRRVKALVLAFMVIAMAAGMYISLTASWKQSKAIMASEVNRYDYKLSEWINTQKSILDMFCSIISTNPRLLDDYEGTVRLLNDITMQYPEISVSYMSNPDLTPSVYMNNGWKPEEGWNVDERQWYIDTMASESGWSVSAPYYDEQTGLYCLTISERVYDAATGDFLGNFGIDFYMDKLVEILGDSYSDTGYAFLVDASGDIINHPYGSYQMSEGNAVNISSLPYGELMPDGESTLVFKDYDRSIRLLMALRNDATNFRVYAVSAIWKSYRRVVIYGLISLIVYLAAIIMVYRMVTDLIMAQDQKNRQMEEAVNAAVSAEKAKSVFLAQMSHEIRTPINAVLGLNEMILRRSDDDEILDYATDIRTAGRTLLSLINSILDFSKLEEGKMKILPVRYSTAILISDMVHQISERARLKGLDFYEEIDDGIPVELIGDDVRIGQVIMNLLTNAVKYTEKGFVTLAVKNGGLLEDGQMDLYVEVRDTGIGIKPEDMDRLFASFERLDEEKNRRIEGTGLGMAIITRLLKMMGSELDVQSVYGRGSVFSFHLKQRIADPTPIGDYHEKAAANTRKLEDGNVLYAPDAKVLVVDDNETNIKVAASMLKLCGINADTALSGMEALGLAERNVYHMILLDHMMPRMDGLETLAAMRERKLLRSETVVIAMTANAISGAREKYLEAGFDDYISKPVEFRLLQDKLVRYLPESIILRREETVNKKSGPDIGKENAAELFRSEHTVEESRDPLKELEKIGIDTAEGQRYCGNSAELYLETIKDYADACAEKVSGMQAFYEKADWENYRILVHSLKSVSKMVGAGELSEEFKKLEEAAKNKDAGYIKNEHDRVRDEYRNITADITRIAGKP
ncbi:MAG: response regulator [Lachnospiraceae bacterium]|nr:response regulator [Lachnospiraceae bacterium]